jgi:plastocyanin
MPRLPFAALALVAVAAFTMTACSEASAPAWTYAPAPSVTPAPSGSGSPSAAPSGSAAPSAAPTPAPSATTSVPASGGAGGTTLTVAAPDGAATTGFDPNKLDGPANAPFVVVFDNQDTTTSPHNWVLKDAAGAKVEIGDTSFFSGPAKKEYQIPALAPGDYPFLCEVHPAAMTGTLTVK